MAKKKATASTAPSRKKLKETVAAYFAASESKKAAERVMKQLRPALVSFATLMGFQKTEKTRLLEVDNISVRWTSSTEPKLDPEIADAILRKRYPALVEEICTALDLEKLAHAAADGRIKSADFAAMCKAKKTERLDVSSIEGSTA